MKNNTHKKEHAHVKNFKKTTDVKGFLIKIRAACG